MADGVAKRYIASMAERFTWKRPVADDFVEHQSPHINVGSMGPHHDEMHKMAC